VAALSSRLAALAAGDDDEYRNAGRYEPVPSPRWWHLTGAERETAPGRLRAWVGQVYRPSYGQLAALLPPCGEQHPLRLNALDWLSELWSVPGGPVVSGLQARTSASGSPAAGRTRQAAAAAPGVDLAALPREPAGDFAAIDTAALRWHFPREASGRYRRSAVVALAPCTDTRLHLRSRWPTARASGDRLVLEARGPDTGEPARPLGPYPVAVGSPAGAHAARRPVAGRAPRGRRAGVRQAGLGEPASALVK
jgi:hypothetical protein